MLKHEDDLLKDIWPFKEECALAMGHTMLIVLKKECNLFMYSCMIEHAADVQSQLKFGVSKTD